ncbi:DUF4232 domain-containing protein [Streptomyces sp. NA04227]|uniref:DUF4232 domain-containing protein n=1 Tax=Streptomyces sp. NA04227 TaxID=2742136 RepID=UPI0015921DFF|nr:DUF4232 domain-containing protein [Streptomyces sp. NA04227]QKW06598.1 DUF4232 domain-containing protein [Streptomyces sp. NA04227]
MSVRNSRTRLLTAAASVALAALSLTACNEDNTGVRDEGASTSSSATASPGSASGSGASGEEGAKPAPDGSKPTANADGTGNGGAAGKTSGGSGDQATGNGGSRTDDSGTDPDKFVTCQGSNTKTVAAPVNRPVNHMLLTVTNTGSVPCFLYYYPAVRFGEAQSVPPVIEDSQPQAVVTLAPGESGYASVNLSAADGTGTDGRTEKSLEVHFQGRDQDHEEDLSPARPPLPAEGVYIDDSLKVTYWQQEMEDALSW